LLEHPEINVNHTRLDGVTPLYLAATKGYIEVIELLLSRGSNVNIEDHNGKTALRQALVGGHIDSAKVLIEYGTNITGLNYNQMSRYEETRDLYDDAISMCATLNRPALQADCLGWKAVFLTALNKLPDAMVCLHQAVTFDQSPQHKLLLAQAYALQGLHGTAGASVDAERSFNEALAMQQEASIYLYYGGFLFLQQRTAEAIKAWENALQAPKAAEITCLRHLAIGTVLPPLQHEIKTLHVFRSSPTLLAHFSLVYAYQQQGNQEKAELHFEQLSNAMAELELFHTHYSLYGHAFYCLGDYQSASWSFRLANEIYEINTPGKSYTLAKVNQQVCLSRIMGAGCLYQEHLAVSEKEKMEGAASKIQKYWREYVVRSRMETGEAQERS
jgi:tetratricopeptide (TPR) repeat protein